MDKKKKIALCAVIIFVFWGAYFYFSSKNTPTPDLIQNNRAELPLSFTTTERTTVYDFMDKLRKDGRIAFTEKEYAGMGKFIKAINGIQSNGDQNWIYYVNDQKAEVGVSNYKINPGDVVSWKYEKSY
jgi:hypothetical protein